MSVVKFCLLRASSSMVEQWPFKPLVESSSLSSLTSITKHPQGCFFIGWSPIEGCIRASPRSQASQNIRKGVFYWLEPHRGMHSSLSSLTSITKHPQGCFLLAGAPSRDESSLSSLTSITKHNLKECS